MNSVKAGNAVPVKFSLGGNQGLDVFAEGYPKSQQISCDSSAQVNGIEETVTANASGLTYDAGADQYNYVWKTEKAWSGTCRQLVVKLKDGTYHRANYQLKEIAARAGSGKPARLSTPPATTTWPTVMP